MPKGSSGKLKMSGNSEPDLSKAAEAAATSSTASAQKPDAQSKPATEKPESVGVKPTSPDAKAKRKLPSWLWFTVAILLGLFYAWGLFDAFANLFGVVAQLNRLNENLELNHLNTVAIPWIPLLANVALPIVVYLLALFVSRKRNPGVLAIALLCGLGVVAAGSFSLAELVSLLAR